MTPTLGATPQDVHEAGRRAFYPPYEWWKNDDPPLIDFDALNLPEKSKSKRVPLSERKYRGQSCGFTWQAKRNKCSITIQHFSAGILQDHMALTFCAREWPRERFDQLHFTQQLWAAMAKRVFGEELGPLVGQEAETIIKAVNLVLAEP